MDVLWSDLFPTSFEFFGLLSEERNRPYEVSRGQAGGRVKEINWHAFDYYPALKRLQIYVQENPDKHLTLREAAAVVAMESTYFSNCFHRKVGICFKHWEDICMVERAVQAFNTSDISVTDAGLGAGFNDLTTFERTFKRVKKMTPVQYRNSVRRRNLNRAE